MSSNIVLCILLLCCMYSLGSDLSMGSMLNTQLAHMETVKLSAVPLKVRTKNVFYNDNSTRVIKGISAIDLDSSKAKASVTTGGVGSPFVNIRLKSQRGDPLNYQIRIYV